MTTTPPRERLRRASLYLCTDARRDQGDLPEFLDTVLAAGVDIVQLRDRSLDVVEELAALEVFARACAAHSALLAVNDRADVAHAVRPDILHLGQRDLPVPSARDIVGPDMIIGRSTNAPDLTSAAAEQDAVDYFCAGPVWSTPTKPGRRAAGLDLVSHAATLNTTRPWFAIGGIDLDNLDQVLDAGARRVVVVRAITEAPDPGAAAAEFARRLSDRTRDDAAG
ncbi:thiamine phosphate synthase [Spiractinospora alimapuensis]|uniref:thiamine phosphate synthase n=1 Tax=Spiractinospora alimapuensis TaxID=2820884 RepID=UPI001EEC6424|nr:thiamine phosphate synthase [Spiractinospora alimapuensis]QVQ53212.1 thiamine phosphate synthase [Spiractinospora alimapuensis]